MPLSWPQMHRAARSCADFATTSSHPYRKERHRSQVEDKESKLRVLGLIVGRWPTQVEWFNMRTSVVGLLNEVAATGEHGDG